METKINSKISFINKKMTEQNNPFDLWLLKEKFKKVFRKV
jgi:hypothetical protein